MTTSVTATFVFTDLVDSTATAARLGLAGAEELRQTHFRLLRGAVAASGGVEVKNLGDGLMLTYSSPSRALAGAVGMQQAIEHHNRSGGPPLGVRIGISTGEATEEDGDYFGDPVVEAARLCAAADGGQILASELVRLMVGRHAAQTFVEVGLLELKGIPESVAVVEVLWEPADAAGSVPLPGRLVGAATDALFGFFGRVPELDALNEARKRAHSTKRCQLVLVAGEAGMGKTALVAQVARMAHADGAAVLFGHSDEDLGVAYQPWMEALSVLVRDGDAEVTAGLRQPQLAALARLIPEVGENGSRVADPDMERGLLLEGVTELLAAASATVSVLLVLDDLHWADAASLQLVRYVAGSTREMDVTIACTYRDTDLRRGDSLSNLLVDLHREGKVTRLPLVGLEDDELIELMAAAAGHDLDDRGVGLAHALRRETDGNPFFMAEMLRHLGESGAIVLGDDGRWQVDTTLDELGLPTSVRDVVGRRVERLGNEARRVLCLAAVIGRDFDLGLLALLADIDEDPLLDLMDVAVTAAVLVESDAADRYRFAHALVQHALYDELSPARRQRAHQRIAEALEAESTADDAATLAELARHWVAAIRPAELDKAIEYVRRAGDAARDALASDDAIRWYEQALDLLDRHAAPDRRLRAELLVRLGSTQNRAANADYRDTLLQAADLAAELDDAELLIGAALGFADGRGESQTGDNDAKRVIATALDRIATDPTPTRARLLATLALAHDGSLEWRTRHDLVLEAIDMARRANDDITFVRIVETSLTTLATPDRRDECIEDIETGVTIADRLGDPYVQARMRCLLVWSRYQQVDVSGADNVLAELEDLVEAINLPSVRWHHALLETARLLLTGQLEQADIANNRTLELGTAANVPDAMGAFGGLLINIRMQQGRLDEIADFILDAARENPSIAAIRATVPYVLSETGRTDDAAQHLSAEAATGFDLPYNGLWLPTMCHLADAAASTGDRDSANALVQLLAPYAAHVPSPTVIVEGSTARSLARAATVLGDYDQAEQWFVVAHDIHSRLRAPYYTALGRLDHADLCIARAAPGDLERARQLATTATATAAEYGFAGLAKRADKLLADT